MSNAKKLLEKREEKPKTVRTRKVKIDLGSLRPAVVDGKFVGQLKDRIYFVRTVERGKREIHEGEVMRVYEDGSVLVWDETKGQQWCFSPERDADNEVKFAT